MEEDLAWINEDTERKAIDEVKAKLATKLDGLPADLCDDLQICRFLRGHNNNPTEAAEFFDKAVAFRSDLVAKEPVAGLRAACASDTVADMTKLPHWSEIHRILPLRPIQGVSHSGNPVMCACPRLIDFEAFAALSKTEDGDQKLQEFVSCMLEQRALVLHNLSHKHKRMVKYDDLRDMTQVSIPTIMTSGLIGKLKGMLGTLQDFYPESIHQVSIWSAPPAFSKLFGLISNILNARMQAKIKVFQRGAFFEEFAPRLDATAVHSWVQQATSEIDIHSFNLLNGCQELISRWVGKGHACNWSIELQDGADVMMHRYFVPQAGAGTESGPLSIEKDVTIKKDEPYSGNFTADCDGVLVLCLDNYYSWWNTKQVCLKFT